MNMNIHDVTEIKLTDIEELHPDFSPTFVRDIIIKSKDGREDKITLFANKKEQLII